MFWGDRRLLVDGAVSDPVRPHNGIPAGCGLAVDFCMLICPAPWVSRARILLITGNMVLVAVGRRVGPDLCESFLQVREAHVRAGMVLNQWASLGHGCLAEPQPPPAYLYGQGFGGGCAVGAVEEPGPAGKGWNLHVAIGGGSGSQSRPFLPFVRAKGGVLCVLFLFLPPVLGGNLVAEGGGPSWETSPGQRPWPTSSVPALILS